MPDSTFYQPFQKPSKKEWFLLLGENAQRQIIVSKKVKAPVFVHQDDATSYPPLAGKNDNQWNIVEKVSTSNPQIANQQAIDALMGGADEILFVLRKLPDFQTLLNSIELSMIYTAFEWQNASPAKMLQLMELVQAVARNTHDLKGSFQLNPFSKTNRLKPGLNEYLQKGNQLFPGFQLFSLRQNETIEIEQALAQIIQQIEKLLRLDGDKLFIARRVQIQLFAKQNILTTIATIRAFKLLWFQILKQHDVSIIAPDISITLDDAQWHDDVNQNRILATTQAMAAVIGGCNHLIIPSKKNDAFSARINRNVQHVMKMESNMDRVADPAAGSKIIEALTDAIANAAWEIIIN